MFTVKTLMLPWRRNPARPWVIGLLGLLWCDLHNKYVKDIYVECWWLRFFLSRVLKDCGVLGAYTLYTSYLHGLLTSSWGQLGLVDIFISLVWALRVLQLFTFQELWTENIPSSLWRTIEDNYWNVLFCLMFWGWWAMLGNCIVLSTSINSFRWAPASL